MEKLFQDHGCCSPKRTNLLIVSAVASSWKRKPSLVRNPGSKKFWKLNSKMSEHENSSDHQKSFKEWKWLEMTLNKSKKKTSRESYKNNERKIDLETGFNTFTRCREVSDEREPAF